MSGVWLWGGCVTSVSCSSPVDPTCGNQRLAAPVHLEGAGPDGSSLRLLQFSHSVVSDSVTPWTAAHQASLSITSSQSLLKLMSIELVMPSNYVILCRPLLLPPSLFPYTTLFRSHVHGVSDIIRPSHPLSSPSPPAFSLSQHQGLF